MRELLSIITLNEMKKEKRMKIENYLMLIAIICVLILVSGQQGCEMMGSGESGAKKTGIDYSLINGVDYLTAGKTLQQGELFYVGIHIENYDKMPKSGQLCIKDDIAESFGGISSSSDGECQFFNVRAADILKKQSTGFGGTQITEQITPGVADVYFPQDQEYSYNSLPSLLKPYNGLLTVSLKYRQTGQATATLTVPTDEQPVMTQEPAPITVTVTKSIHKRQDGYKVDLDILLKKDPNMKIFSSDFAKENVSYFNVELLPQTMSCSYSNGEPIQNPIIIENEKLIKCSSIVNMAGEAQQSYPLVITLDYGVNIQRTYPFNIETKIK